MKKIRSYQTFLSKKKKVKLEGSNKSYDDIYSENSRFVVFRNNVENDEEFYLYSLETGKLLLVSKNYEIKLFNYYKNDLFYIEISNIKYLFKINSNTLESNNGYVYVVEIGSAESVELLKGIPTFTFISEFSNFYYGSNLFFTAQNEIFAINENFEKEEIECPFKNDTSYSINYLNTMGNGTYSIIFSCSKSNVHKACTNLCNTKQKKFILKKFIDVDVNDYKIYNEKVYIINHSNEIFDENGDFLVSDPLATKITFHPRLPYVFTERKDRKGLISLEQKKILYKPIYIEILVDEEEIMLLDSEGGAYQTVKIYQ